MSNIKKSTEFLDRLNGTWGTLQQFFCGNARTPPRRGRRPAPLQELEDRRLLSATPGIHVTGSTFLVAEDNNVARINASTGAVVATYPTGLANDGATFGPDGSLYMADYYVNKINHYNASGTFLSSFNTTGTPQGLAIGPDGNLYVTTSNSTVEKYSPTGTSLATFISAGSGGLSNAKAIVWGPDGNAYVSSYFNSEVIRYNGTTGAFMNVFATGTGGFEDITFGPDNNLYVASYGDNAVYRYNGTTGASMGTFASGPQLNTPYGLRFDSAGNLDVSNRTPGNIQTFNSTGTFVHTLTNGLTNPAYLTDTTSLVTTEMGTSASFQVALTSQPTATVTINLGMSVAGQGSLSQSTLTFDASNWSMGQSVNVTGRDDHIVNGNQTYQITGTATSADANYNTMTMTPVSVTNTEADVAGITVTPTSLQTSKAGASASFSVSLTSQPVSPVTISLSNTNSAEGSLSSSSLTFNAGNWNVAQTVTVTGLNDGMANGNPTYQINGAATSTDGKYNGLAMTPVTVTNFDTSTGPVLTTSESRTSATFSVALSGLPLFPVTVNLTNGNPAQGSLSQSSLTFNLLNWNVPQSVTVTGLDDHMVNGNQIYQITGVASSLDPSYNGLAMNPVIVTNTEADVAGFTVTPTSLTTSESGASASFTVALTSQPIAPVSVNLQPTDPSQGSLSQSTLAFDASNWNVLQTVTVTGLDSYMTTPSVTYQITGSASSADANYNNLNTTPVTVTNTETPNASSTSIVASTNPSVYGQAVTFTATISGVASMTGTPTGTVTFIDGSTNLAAVALAGGSAAFTTSALSAGTHSITVAFSGDAYFTASTSAPLTETVAPATLTVAAIDASKVYGQANPAFGDTISGFVHGDTASVVSGSASLSTTATTSSAVGAYAITAAQGSLNAANYTFAFSNGSLTVNPAVLAVTANDASKAYGQTLAFAGTEFTTSGLVNSDTVAGLTLTSAGAAATANVAGSPYAITASAATGTGLGNYTISYVNGSLTVNPVALTITADNASKAYGQTLAFAGTEFTTSGLVNSDTVSGVTLTSAGTPATATLAGSPFAITASAATGAALGNYNITYVAATLSVTPATLTVTANNGTKVYGQANPAFSNILTGFVNSDNASVVSGSASLTTTATAGSGLGSYTIAAAQGSLSAANYTFAFANGTLTITPVAVPTPPPTSAAPPTLIGPVVLLPVPPLFPTHAVGTNVVPTATPQPSLPSATTIVSPFSAITPNARTGNESLESGSQTLLAQAAIVATRTMHVFAPIPQSTWRPVQDLGTTAVPEESPFHATLSRILTLPFTPSTLQSAQADDLLDILSDDGDRIPWTEPGLETTVLVGTGIFASSGYVLLNSRLGLWLLGLLTTRPMWKQFDPLEVLYAWEDDDRNRTLDDEDEETLMSLVD